MRAAVKLTAHLLALLALLAALASCELFGGATQVRFLNSTASTTFTSIHFGSVVDNSPLAPTQETSYFPVPPGQNLLLAQMQDGTWTNGIQLAITAGHSYTITFSGTAPAIMVSIAADP